MIKKIFEQVLYFVVFAVLPAVLFLLLTSRTSAILGIRSFDVLTGSMEPVIPVGSLVFTVPQKSYKLGEVITVKRGDITVTHRIIAQKTGQFQVKGDANNTPDYQLVNKADIIGKDIAVFPYFGYFIHFVKTIPGFVLLVIIPTLIFVVFEATSIKREWEKEIEKRVLEKRQGLPSHDY